MVTTVSRPDAPVYTLRSFVVEKGQPGVVQTAGAQSQEARVPQSRSNRPDTNPRVANDRRMEAGG